MARPFPPPHDPHAAREERTQQLLRAAAAARSAARRDRLRHEAASLNVDLALGVARPFHGRGIEDDDIDQVALLGLWKSVLRYTDRPDDQEHREHSEYREHGEHSEHDGGADPAPSSEGRRFAAYAIPTITGEVKRHFRDHGWMVRPPRAVQERTLAVNHAVLALRHELGREPRDADLATFLGLTRHELDQARQARQGYSSLSLDATVDPDGSTSWADTVPDEEDSFDLVDTRLSLQRAVDELGEADRRLLVMRYGQGMTQSAIGSVLGVSQMQVSRRLLSLHQRLRGRLAQEAS